MEPERNEECFQAFIAHYAGTDDEELAGRFSDAARECDAHYQMLELWHGDVDGRDNIFEGMKRIRQHIEDPDSVEHEDVIDIDVAFPSIDIVVDLMNENPGFDHKDSPVGKAILDFEVLFSRIPRDEWPMMLTFLERFVVAMRDPEGWQRAHQWVADNADRFDGHVSIFDEQGKFVGPAGGSGEGE